MATVSIDRAKLQRLFQSALIERDLDRRAQNVLRKMIETAPRDTGDLANSFRIASMIELGKRIVRILSDDPQMKAIVQGTKGPYNAAPPWGPDSALGGWGSRHGFTTKRSMYALARSIASHGTNPAGTVSGRRDWIKESIREAAR